MSHSRVRLQSFSRNPLPTLVMWKRNRSYLLLILVQIKMEVGQKVYGEN